MRNAALRVIRDSMVYNFMEPEHRRYLGVLK